MDDQVSLSQQELAVHLFAPMTGPQADAAYQQLLEVWSRCRQWLKTTEAIERLDMPRDPPADLADLPQCGSTDVGVAAQQSADRDIQAIMRRTHDVLNLSVVLAHPERGDAASHWRERERQWDAAVEGVELSALLGSCRLYLAKVDGRVAATAELADAAAESLPVSGDIAPVRDWGGRGLVTAGGFAAWEVSPRVEERAARRIVVLARPEDDAKLSAWVWSRGDAQMTPFARYLMNAAKVRYELRVRRGGEVDVVKDLSHHLDRELAHLTPVLEATRFSRTIDGDQLGAARETLTGLWLDQYQAALLADQLREMTDAVDIARLNIVEMSRGFVTAGPGTRDLVGDDLSLVEHLLAQLGKDVASLDRCAGKAERANVMAAELPALTRATAPTVPTIGIVTALPEEFVAMQAMLECPLPRLDQGTVRAYHVEGTLPSFDPDRPHKVVLCLLPRTSNPIAAVIGAGLVDAFATIDQVMMVGIACGVPNPADPPRHVRLGDVVVATNIVDFDHVRVFANEEQLRQPPWMPSAALSVAESVLRTAELRSERPWEQYIDTISPTIDGFARPPAQADQLYANDWSNRRRSHPAPDVSGHRDGRPKIHRGPIGSANTSFRSARKRDKVAAAHELLAIEMEAGGLAAATWVTGRGCFVVRGISDYGDGHTRPGQIRQDWRRYAALAAAAYTKALLSQCAPLMPRRTERPG